MASPSGGRISTRSHAQRDPSYDRLLASKAVMTSRSDEPMHPYELLLELDKEDYDKIWNDKIIAHHSFDHANSHLTKPKLKAVKTHLAFTRLNGKPLFSPYATTGSFYSQVRVDKPKTVRRDGHDDDHDDHVDGPKADPYVRESTHMFAAIYKLRFLEPRPLQIPPHELKDMLGRSGFKAAYCASHLVCNYKGNTHDINPWNITVEPMDINSSRRTCMIRWCKNQYMANHPLDGSIQGFYLPGGGQEPYP